jgi:threonine 3-dehydrogenase
VTGCGPIGLCAVSIARAAGATWVVATDTEPYRLELATQMGADLVLDGRNPETVAKVLEATGGDGVDVVLEMSGSAAALDQGLRFVTRGGRISLLGIFGEPVAVDLSNLVIEKGVRVHGVFGRRIYDTWERTQDLLRSGALDVAPILTHRFDLADWQQGFDLLGSRHAGKVVLTP